MSKSLKVVGEGALYLSGNGQGLRDLETDPVAKANRPPVIGSGFDTCHLTLYDKTNLVQWVGRRSDGRFYPHGKIMQLVVSERHEPESGPLEMVGWSTEKAWPWTDDLQEVARDGDVAPVFQVYRGPVEYVAATPIEDEDGHVRGCKYEVRPTESEARALLKP